jgi:hypothetical protein
MKKEASDDSVQGGLARQYMIQVEREGERLDFGPISEILAGTGVELDPNYRPVPVNPALGRYVVRGRAADAARKRAELIPGVQFFGGLKIRATNGLH